ncbi:hypothetical protein ACH4Y0_07840 [Streptomyces sp. NPDC020707]|jgi:hypothetical protein|uniref:hypothetical protein n=1 Tax=unclassified Streptomyces TaxID=2593676 RepID=UPI0037A9FC29
MAEYFTVKIRRMGVSLGTVNASGAIALIAAGVVHDGSSIAGVVVVSVAALGRDAVIAWAPRLRDSGNGNPPGIPGMPVL